MRTITNRELPFVRDLLTRLNGVPNIKLAYASAKTIKKIAGELKDLDQVRQPDDEFREFNNELEAVKRKWSRKRASGEPATRLDRMGDQMVEVYDIPSEDMESYQLEAERLEKDFIEVINRQKTREKNYEELMDQPTTCDFHMVELDEVKPILEQDPEHKSKVNGAQFAALAFLLKKPEIKMEMVPEDISQSDMLTLVEYFDL